MKILSKEQIRSADQYTINNEPIASIDLMESASKAFCEAFYEEFSPDKPVNIFCGKGNNGGDGLAVSRLLFERGYDVQAWVIEHTDDASPDFQTNLERLMKSGVKLSHLNDHDPLPDLNEDNVIVDAIFGTGLTRPLEGFPARVIDHLNQLNGYKVAIDIPSGLYCDGHNTGKSIFQAHLTFTFQAPKLSFLIPESGIYAGHFRVLDIGLSREYIDELKTNFYYLQKDDVAGFVGLRKKFTHKGNYGHGLICAGSYGKVGAAILALQGCLYSGCGLITAHVPECGYIPLQSAVPEIMVIPANDDKFLQGELPAPGEWDAIGAGPGMGNNKQTAQFIERLLESVQCPLVLDADAINVLASSPALLKRMPENTVLTPHPGEFDRLAGISDDGFQRLENAKKLTRDYNCIIVLKGTHTAIITPEAEAAFNSTANAGMATAGMGDVLTGMITALLARGINPADAARTAVYVHGKAGDLALKQYGENGLTAGGLLEFLPEALKSLENA